MLNITDFCGMTPEQILLNVHKELVVPNLIILSILASFSFLIIGVILVNTRTKGKPAKFSWIWTLSVLLIVIIVAFLIASPNTVNSIIEWVRMLFT